MPSFDGFASDWDNSANQEYPSLGEGQAQTLTYYVNTTLFNATNQVRLGLGLGLTLALTLALNVALTLTLTLALTLTLTLTLTLISAGRSTPTPPAQRRFPPPRAWA